MPIDICGPGYGGALCWDPAFELNEDESYKVELCLKLLMCEGCEL